MNVRVLACGLTLTLFAHAAIADTFQPSPSSYKPTKPYKFTSQWEVDSYNNDVERYKQCIKAFVEEQQLAAATHKRAAAEAIEQWNNFVKYELN